MALEIHRQDIISAESRMMLSGNTILFLILCADMHAVILLGRFILIMLLNLQKHLFLYLSIPGRIMS